MARVNGPSRDELDARGKEFAARVERAIHTTLRVVAADTRVIDDLARIQTVWKSVVARALAPRLRIAWNVAVDGIREQLEKISERDPEVLVAAGFVIPKVSNPLAEVFLSEATNRLANIGDHVWYTARGEMITGMQLGEGVAELRARVVASASVSVPRATTIARTEVNSAMNNGAYEQMKALDVPTIKEWIATDDARTRESHEEVDGEEIAGDAKFMVGGFPMDHPHDPAGPPGETINCRCTLAWEIADDEDDYEDALAAAGDFDESKHKRDGKGRFAKKPGGGSAPKGKKLKVTHMLVHKKHAPGTIIAINGSDDKRAVWDGNKYLLQEKQADGGWVTVSTAIKTKAYVAINGFDGDWREPGDDSGVTELPDPVDVAANSKPSGGVKKSKVSKKSVQPGAPIKVTHGLVHQKHEPGTVIAENGASDKRVVWDGYEYHLQRKKDDGKWTTEKTALKSKAYVAINAYDSDWRAPADDAGESSSAPSSTPSASTGPVKSPGATAMPKKTAGSNAPPSDDTDDIILDDELTGPQPITGYKKIGAQAGSNTGGLYQAPDGQKWYVKAPKSDDHAKNEVLANQLYAAAGIEVPQVEFALLDGGPIVGKTGLGVKSKVIDGTSNLSTMIKDPAFKKKLHQGFAVDAWLGNWDVAGLGYDNIITDQSGNPVRIDAGGSLLFRAQGMSKGNAFSSEVKEIDTLRNPSINPSAATVYEGITDDEIREGVARVEAITPEQIDSLVDQAGFTGSLANHLKTTLKERRQDLINKFTKPTNTAADSAPPTTTYTPATPTPKAKATGVVPKTMGNLTKIGGKIGNQDGALYADETGTEWYVKPSPTDSHARNEFLAANLYAFLDVRIPSTSLVQLDPAEFNGKTGLGVKQAYFTHTGPSASELVRSDAKFKEELYENYAIDAWLGNWGVVGVGQENIVKDPKTGKPIRRNLNGSMMFKPSGMAKGEQFSSSMVPEIDMLRNPSISPSTAAVFGGVTEADIHKGVAKLAKLSPNVIDFVVDQSGFTGDEAATLKNTLKARRKWLLDKYGVPPTDVPPSTMPSATPATAPVNAPAPSTQPTAANALGGGIKTYTALQKAKVQSIFAKHNLKWYNKTNAIYDAAHEVSTTHPDLTMADALAIMDQSLKKKSGNPFQTKVEKWLKTNAGKQHALAKGGSAAIGGTTPKTSPSASAPPPVDPNATYYKINRAQAKAMQARMDLAEPPPWTDEQRNSLYVYTGSSYKAINSCLREPGACPPGVSAHVANIKSAMKASTHNIQVYRSAHPAVFGIKEFSTDTALKRLNEMVGKTIKDDGVISTSITNIGWDGVVKILIDVPKGSKMAWVQPISQHPAEDEIVLAPGTHYEVISFDLDTRQLRLRVIPGSEAP